MNACHAAVERFRTVVASRLGLKFDDRQLAGLGETLARRLQARAMDSQTYLDAFDSGLMPDEPDALAHDLTVCETYFFRNAEQFDALRAQVLPELMKSRQQSRRLRILSAGCASGEEAYSIAMVLQDLAPAAEWDVSLLGVDLNPAALDKARRARYTSWSLRETPAAARQRWFRAEGDEFVLAPEVCARVRFEPLNLHAPAPGFWVPGSFDLVFCRNVLMYFTPSGLQAAVARIIGALAPGGYLFLGHAESLRDASKDIQLCHTHRTFYYRRALADGVGDPPVDRPARASWAPAGPVDKVSWVEAIGQASERVAQLTRPPQVTERAPADPPPGLAEAMALFHHEAFDEALALLECMAPAARGDPAVLLLQAVLQVHKGRLDQAEELAHGVLALDPSSAGAHYVLALCRENAGDVTAAGNRYQLAARLDPGFAMPRLHLGLLARRRGDQSALRRELAQALALLVHEDTERLMMFGGGFDRDALLALCRAELRAAGANP